MCLQYTSFEQSVGKEEITCNKQFLLSHSVFYPFKELYTILIKFKIVVSKLIQFGIVYNLLFGKGLSSFPDNKILALHKFTTSANQISM